METIKLTSKGVTQLRFGNRAVYAMRYSANKITYDQVNKFCTQESKKMAKKNMHGYIQVNTNCTWTHPEWRTSKLFKIGDDVYAYGGEGASDNDEHQALFRNGKYSNFIIYFAQMPAYEMGCDDELNDCLYECIKHFFENDRMKIPETRVNSAKKLKKFLGLERADLVSIECLQKIADYLCINIEVTGDHTLLTTGEFKRTMSIEMKEGHVSPKKHQQVKLSNMNWKKKSESLAYRVIEGKIETYNINDGFNEDHDKKAFANLKYKGRYALFKVKNKPCQEDVINFEAMARNIHEISKGVIDVMRYGDKYTDIAKYLFNVTNTEHIDVDPIKPIETNFLTISGGLTFSKECTEYKSEDTNTVFEGEGKQYDVNFSYGHEMSKKSNSFPIGEGEVTIVESNIFEKKGYYPYGIYRAVVHRSNNLNTDSLFRFQKHGEVYTHIDLTEAKRLKLKVEIIQDGKHNAILYTKRIAGNVLFGGFVSYMIKLVSHPDMLDTSKRFLKMVRSSLWGSLCQIKTTKYHKKDDQIVVPSDAVATEINEEMGYMKVYTNQDKFVTNFARIGPFLTAWGRKAVVGWMEPYIERVCRCSTDGFVVCGDINLPVGSEIGMLKFEDKKSGNMRVFKQITKVPVML